MSIYVSPYYNSLRTNLMNSLFGFDNSSNGVGSSGDIRNIAASIAQQRLASYLLKQAIQNLVLLSASSDWLGGGGFGGGFSGLRYGGLSYSGYGDYYPYYDNGSTSFSSDANSSGSASGSGSTSSSGGNTSGSGGVEGNDDDNSHNHGNHGAGYSDNGNSSSISGLNLGNLVSNPPQNGTVNIQMQQTTSQNIQLTYTNAHLSSVSYSQSNSSVFNFSQTQNALSVQA